MNECCGNCLLFKEEDMRGQGWCEKHQQAETCDNYCGEWKPLKCKHQRIYYCDLTFGWRCLDCGGYIERRKSKCCNATVQAAGRTTHYYVCDKCGQPCDCKEKI